MMLCGGLSFSRASKRSGESRRLKYEEERGQPAFDGSFMHTVDFTPFRDLQSTESTVWAVLSPGKGSQRRNAVIVVFSA